MLYIGREWSPGDSIAHTDSKCSIGDNLAERGRPYLNLLDPTHG